MYSLQDGNVYTTRLIIPELLSSDDEQTGKVTVRNSVGTTEYQFQFQNLTGLLLEIKIHRQKKLLKPFFPRLLENWSNCWYCCWSHWRNCSSWIGCILRLEVEEEKEERQRYYSDPNLKNLEKC